MSQNKGETNKYPIRKSALISPWGIGAIVPVSSGETFMVAGLDFWFDGKDPICSKTFSCYEVKDARLSERLRGRRFVQPPEFLTKEQDYDHAGIKIPVTRFPRTYYCPVCGNIVENVGDRAEQPRCPGDVRKKSAEGTYCSKMKAAGKNTPTMVPERFIAVCENGHIEDFPIAEWVHKKSGKTYTPETCKMYRSTGGNSAALSGVRYACTCGASYTMAGAFDWDEEHHGSALSKIGYNCQGKSPWLGTVHQGCDKFFRSRCRGELLRTSDGSRLSEFQD